MNADRDQSEDRTKHYCGPGCDAPNAIPIPAVSVSGAAREATEAQVIAARVTWDAVVPQHESVRMSDSEWTCTCTHPRDLAFASAVDWEAHADVAIAHAVADAVVAAGPRVDIEITEAMGKPSEARIWRDGVLVWDGVSRDFVVAAGPVDAELAAVVAEHDAAKAEVARLGVVVRDYGQQSIRRSKDYAHGLRVAEDRADRAEATLAKVAELAADMDKRGRPGENDSPTDVAHRWQIREDVKRLRHALIPEPQADSKPGQNLEVPHGNLFVVWFPCPACGADMHSRVAVTGGMREGRIRADQNSICRPILTAEPVFHECPAPEAPTEATQTGGEVR